MSAKTQVEELLNLADVKIGRDMHVHDERLYARVLASSSLGFGQAYMDGWWDAPRVDELMFKLLSARLDQKISPWSMILPVISARIRNKQSKSRAFEVGEKHYDLGNDLFEAMLDKRMVYTCAYWKGLGHEPENLDIAQEQKLDLVCKKIGLKKGDHVLDIGCGWGSFAKYAAENYGAKVTGITISREQMALAKELCTGLDVEIKLMDYRDIQGEYDHVVSLGMFEHVGMKNYRTYMQTVRRVLADDGLFLLQTIGHNRKDTGVDPWIERYIFPNGVIPQSSLVTESFEDLFIMEDWHNFGADYDTTLMAWHKNFEEAWNKLKLAGKYSERFYRMWRYYLLACAGAFRVRHSIELWQIVLSKNGVKGGYTSVR